MWRRQLLVRASLLVAVPLTVLAGSAVADDRFVGDSGVTERAALAEVYEGQLPEGPCSQVTTDLMLKRSPEELESLIGAAGGTDRLLSDGGYAGSLQQAAVGLNGQLVSQNPTDLEGWMIVRNGGVRTAVQLRGFENASGITVWYKSDTSSTCAAESVGTRPLVAPSAVGASITISTDWGLER